MKGKQCCGGPYRLQVHKRAINTRNTTQGVLPTREPLTRAPVAQYWTLSSCCCSHVPITLPINPAPPLIPYKGLEENAVSLGAPNPSYCQARQGKFNLCPEVRRVGKITNVDTNQLISAAIKNRHFVSVITLIGIIRRKRT